MQHARRTTLDRQVDVVAQDFVAVDCVNDVLAEVSGMRSCEAHATNPRNAANGVKQFGEALLPCRILVRIYVLAQQLNLGVAEIGHPTRFGENGIGGPAALFAASE